MVDRRLRLLMAILFVLVGFDAAKFWLFGRPSIINWHSFIHPFWVLLAGALYLVGGFVNAKWYWNLLLGLYALVTAAALVNVYRPFTSVVTYNCFLFNLLWVALYMFLGARDLP